MDTIATAMMVATHSIAARSRGGNRACTKMSFIPFEDTTAWGVTQAVGADQGDIVANAMKKERIIRYSSSSHIFHCLIWSIREIVAAQEDLKSLYRELFLDALIS